MPWSKYRNTFQAYQPAATRIQDIIQQIYSNVDFLIDLDSVMVLLHLTHTPPIFSLIPSFSLPDVLCDATDLIWRKGTPFEAMTVRTAPSSDGLLAEVFWGFPQL